MSKVENLVGEQFGYLKVERFLEPEERLHNGKIIPDRIWECSCKCGNIINVSTHALKTGNTKSCGCYRKEKLKDTQFKRTHGKTNIRLYSIWDGMKSRCYRKSANNYKIYGGRGIKICDEWKKNFQSFYNWAIQNGYKDGLTIDRIDVNGNYEPDNCRWATAKEQAANKRDTLYVDYHGEQKKFLDISKETGIPYYKLYQRVFGMGKDIDEAIKTEGYNKDKCKHIKYDYIGENLTISELCDKYGISDKSFAYRWSEKGKDFEWILKRWNEKKNIPYGYVDTLFYSNLIGVSRTQVQRLLKQGKIEGRKFGREWYVKQKEV